MPSFLINYFLKKYECNVGNVIYKCVFAFSNAIKRIKIWCVFFNISEMPTKPFFILKYKYPVACFIN